MLPVIFSLLVFSLSLLIHDAYGSGVSFTKPAPGGTYPSGIFDVAWIDAGGTPSMSELELYTLQLVVGGNTAQDSRPLQTIGSANGSVAQGGVQGIIAPDVAQSIQNGFYLMMTSNTTDGNQVINYSDRFTLVSMNGTTDSQYLNGAQSQAGDSANVPDTQYNVLTPAPSITTSSTSTASPTAAPTSSSGSNQSTDTGLSTADMAGLIVGAVLACIGIVSLLIWALLLGRKVRRKREEKKMAQLESTRAIRQSKPAFVDGKAELSGQSVCTSGLTFHNELSPDETRSEVPGWGTVAEAPGSDMIYELEGDWNGWEAGSGRKSKAYDPTL